MVVKRNVNPRGSAEVTGSGDRTVNPQVGHNYVATACVGRACVVMAYVVMPYVVMA